ncbi:MAG: OsmC family protein [Elusimicrobiota bacterium]|jgi:ribosomal protein S12 methylthiotransferase accessory factor
MDIEVVLEGNKKVAAKFNGYTVHTDQPAAAGGDGTAPSPFELFLASLATCAGFFALSFCQKRDIPTDGIKLTQKMEWDEAKHLASKISLEISVPASFPEKYLPGLVKSAELCTVKRHLQAPPALEITTRRG